MRRLVDPGVLEYADYKTVRARIFPIPAHGTKTVELEYMQLLKADDGLLKYHFPLKTKGQDTPSAKVKVIVSIKDKHVLAQSGRQVIISLSLGMVTRRPT